MVKKRTHKKVKEQINEFATKSDGHKRSGGPSSKQQHESKPVAESDPYNADRIQISDIEIKWDTPQGMCTFQDLPVAMMWIDTTLAGFMSGVQAMVGTERFGLALQSEGRKSVAADWKIISQFADFAKGFRAIANIAAVAGWGDWELLSLDEKKKRCRIQVRNSWEGLYQKALGVCWGSGMLAGKMAGYCTKHFGTNCWAEQRKFIAKGDEFDEFIIAPSKRTVEEEIENLLATDEATRADMAVALEKLKKEIAVREQAEKTLRESEEKYRRLVDLSFEGIAIHCAGKIVYVNNTGAELIGAGSPKDLIGKPVLDLVHPDDRDAVIKKMQTLAAEGIGATIDEERFIGIDGRELIVEVAGVPVNYQGKPAIQVVFRDKTDLKLKEKALRESEKRYRLLIESIPSVVWVTCQDGRTVFISSNVEQVYGYTPDEILAKGKELWFDRIHPDDGVRVQEAFQRLFDQKVQFNVEYRIRRKDGQWIWIHDRANIVEEQDGDHFAYGVFSDITERKRAAEEKENLQSLLQQVEKIEAIGTLAGGIAHDFNNLLMGIQGRASLMSVGLAPYHPHMEHLNAVEEYIQSAANLTKQLLGFARGGKYEVKPIDMNEVVQNSATMFGRTKKEIKIHTKLCHPSPVVEADRRQIEQVLLNMYVNAWQAMPDGGELYLETKIVALDDEYCQPHQVEAGGYAKVTITDSGTGMDETTRQRVFDPFFTTKEKGRGTGLGLASAYGIIKNHGGIISVYSEVDYGTSFHIFLPLTNKAEYRETPAEEKLIQGTENILLVDDEEMIIEVGKAMLEELGYRVVVAKGGREALDAVTNMGSQIDLVILDLIMPGFDGGKTFDRIREIQPLMRVMLSSGYAINGQAEEIMRRGCNGFIQKPFNISELSKQVRRILDERKA
jgi:two-component system cell cycle sensor histidine kinase/response regulator CckA